MKRKTILLTVLLLLCLPGLSMADPWLVCDPLTVEVTRIDVDLNGQLINVDTATMRQEVDAWYLLDLSSIAGGSYTAKAKAIYGLWGESDFSNPFAFVKPALDNPANVNIKF